MTSDGNARRLREIEARLAPNTLTQAPWEATVYGGVRHAGIFVFANRREGSYVVTADVEFAAHARADVPWLVARVKQLEAALSVTAQERIGDDVDLDPVDEE